MKKEHYHETDINLIYDAIANMPGSLLINLDNFLKEDDHDRKVMRTFSPRLETFLKELRTGCKEKHVAISSVDLVLIFKNSKSAYPENVLRDLDTFRGNLFVNDARYSSITAYMELWLKQLAIVFFILETTQLHGQKGLFYHEGDGNFFGTPFVTTDLKRFIIYFYWAGNTGGGWYFDMLPMHEDSTQGSHALGPNRKFILIEKRVPSILY